MMVRPPALPISVVAALLFLALAAPAPLVGGEPPAGQPAPDPPRSSRGIPDHYIVVLQNSANPELVAAEKAQQLGLTVSHVYRHALKGFAARIPSDRLASLRADPRILFISEDLRLELFAQTAPTGLRRIGGSTDGVHQTLANKGSGIGVAVVDSGIDLNHPDLAPVDNGTTCISGTQNANDDNGHGTHVAGTIAARDNDIGVVGVAPSATLYAVKVMDAAGSGSFSTVICGVDWVTANASFVRIANMSLGGSGVATPSNTDCTNGNNDALHTAICNSVKAGVTYVVAAGNSSVDASGFVPAAYEEVITVSALADFDGAPGGLGSPTCTTEQDDTFAYFSNYGAPVDIAAPGVCINSTWQSGGYNTISGTSMASPHVAGAAALYKVVNPAATPAQVKAALLASVEFGPVPEDPDSFKEDILSLSTTPRLKATPTAVSPGGSLTAEWSNISAPTPTDWIGLYALGSTDTSYLARRYTTGSSSGTVPFEVPASTAAGPYEIRLFSQDTYQRLAVSNRFDVVTLSASPTTVAAGGSVTATWAGISAPTSLDWIGLYAPGTAENAYVAWRYTTGTSSGSVPFSIPATLAPGTYELRLYPNFSYTRLATSNPLTVTAPPTATPTPTAAAAATPTPTAAASATLAADPTSVAAGASLTATWSGISSPTGTDWIGLYSPGASNTASLAWRYTTGASSGSVPFTIPSSVAPGTYELRLFANNGYTRLATSNSFSVTTAATATPTPTASSPTSTATPTPIAASPTPTPTATATPTPGTVTLTASPTTVKRGGSVTATWSGISSPSTTDWVGLYSPTASNVSYLAWRYTTGTSSGSISLTIPSTLSPGTYELRLFAKNSYTRLATSNSIKVTR